MQDLDRCLKAKIPGAETGIEVKHTFCSICEPLFHCGIDAYIRDGTLVKIEGTPNHPMNHGLLCTKGLCNREYIYRKDRIQTPLRRTGPRGSGTFEPISWEDAYQEIATRLLALRQREGPQAVSFYSGYAKWYRAFLQRLAYAFGSPNFGTESSTCHMATEEAWSVMTGRFSGYDVGNASTFLAWAVNPYYSKPMELKKLYEAKERGQRVVVIDPRITPTVTKLADLHLRIRPGTDGALALGMGKLIIDNGWLDQAYVDRHVHGFNAYAEYVKTFDLARVCDITGLAADDIERATEWYATHKPSCISQSGAPIVHHTNGFQTFRAIMSLSALTGNYDVRGGNIPIGHTYSHQWAGFETREKEFMGDHRPQGGPARVGKDRFPLWEALIDEDQTTDLARHILEEKPYPIRAMVAFGMNHRMFQAPGQMLSAIDKLDFVVSTDLFMTEVCRHSDIVLPVCTSFERQEFKVYPGGWATWIEPVIAPLYQSRPDSVVITQLAKALALNDPLLCSGYEQGVRWMLEGSGLDLDECKKSTSPIPVPAFRPYQPGQYTESGYDTPTGKFELYSQVVARYQDKGLEPLPVWEPPLDGAGAQAFPFVITIGARLPYALHSRLHDVPWVRSLRPRPMADISRQDAQRLGIDRGDEITIWNCWGSICVEANPTDKVMTGSIQMYHGYAEADANELVPPNHLDPYSGYPGYNSVRCAMRRGRGIPG